MASTTSQSSTPRRSKESDRIGSFQRHEEIGRGSFATVYKAIHTSGSGVQSIVAIKSVNMSKLNKKLKDNLTSEISILKGLHHPHIVALIDCKESSSHIHLVMEYVALGDLSHFIKRRNELANSELVGNMMVKYPNPRYGGLHEVVVRHFLQQLASALQFLRARDLIHRDVKPQNLLLNPSPAYFETHNPRPMPYQVADNSLVPICGVRSLPVLKIADFGFARSLPSTALAETLCGSPLYMAPEILRYEKYDATADLWSVGTVLYEMMTARPPFRASNHVELLRKIEKSEDKIKFGDEFKISDDMKKLVRSLLKRDPRQRLSFPDFFSNEIITGPIPGLHPEDMPKVEPPQAEVNRRRDSQTDPTGLSYPASRKEPESPYIDSSKTASEDNLSRRPSTRRQMSGAKEPTSTPLGRPSDVSAPVSDSPKPATVRPALHPHATAPERQDLFQRRLSSAPMVRQTSAGSHKTPASARPQVQNQQQEYVVRRQQEEKERERAAQDIAFERDYVLVEKKAVEVNALADELDASPRLNKQAMQAPVPPKSGTMVRRATTQGPPGSATGAQTSASRAVQIASGRRPDSLHNRQNSYERRYGPSPGSATSAISKALNMASGRLFGVGFSPPVNLMRGGKSPPVAYSPFPTYPGAQSSLVVVGDQGKETVAADEDTRYVQTVEETATRSDVVYGFAEVKYKQLIPAVPSQPGLGLRNASSNNASDCPLGGSDGDLTVEATVIVAEEALVLYVKALALLAKAMDIAARWWARKSREVTGDAATSRPSSTSVATGQRMNNVVQWVRNRFNEVLEKTDLVRLKLVDSQRRLPEDHPSHPNNISSATASSAGLGTSSNQVIVSSGITAEQLMYDRALEMSRAAAINELTNEDLAGCEISYVTAIRMLEAVLENDDDSSGNEHDEKEDAAPINGLEAEDRKAVKNLVSSIRGRLSIIRRKLQVIQKHASAPGTASPTSRASPPIPYRGGNPAAAVTPPRS
ncbi:Serine/threonine-protein kinase [Exophiala dermatitidis]|uniref:Serine/threonine-protein kinase ATG1 n=1 Tax=Exophiala dermatitidis TaxID=5970 RepID=A0AAN6EPB7_EXODE|nr:Serine/threonine-protein kinase [Exophiala dermatitidis]KAJ4506448.1 Serine/threonine-protein kinase [Exophiala dermatitidis]KAJ4533625.1 Serine/threonine-protein kinase [Exophiala dermatitidis]KAJ4547443.1 Serine/threonine-protein kinase [Exophiala dermatitidis]KAJ4560362.1 Serine/threonine-protein kinase [Exophiala dermatitidis]